MDFATVTAIDVVPITNNRPIPINTQKHPAFVVSAQIRLLVVHTGYFLVKDTLILKSKSGLACTASERNPGQF